MASIKNLKKEIGDQVIKVIDECAYWELDNPKSDTTKSTEIVDKAIETYNELVAKVNNRKVENLKSHFKSIREELKTKLTELDSQVSGL